CSSCSTACRRRPRPARSAPPVVAGAGRSSELPASVGLRKCVHRERRRDTSDATRRPPSAMPDRFDRDFPATLTSLAEARHQLRAWLADAVRDPNAANDLLTVAGEFFLHVVVRTGGDQGRARLVAE